MPSTPAVGSRARSWRLAAIWLMATSLALIAFDRVSPWSLRYNASPSLPTGLYLATEYRGRPLALGEIACFGYKAPDWAAEREYFAQGFSLCKYVLARPTETVLLEDNAHLVRDAQGAVRALGARMLADSAGRPVRGAYEAAHTLGPGQYWLGSLRHPRSIDSRYLGAQHARDITVTLRPLWVRG